MLRVTKYLREFRSGSSLPILVEASNNKQYVCKLKGAGDGTLALMAEYLAMRLAYCYGVPTLQPVIIQLDNCTIPEQVDPEVIELMQRSIGLNLATEYYPQDLPIDIHQQNISAQTKRTLFLFDLLVLNVDRTSENINALSTPDGIRWIDFGSAVAIRTAILNINTSETPLLQCFPYHPWYNEVASIDTTDISSLPEEQIQQAVYELPEEWFNDIRKQFPNSSTPEQLLNRLSALFCNKQILIDRINIVQTVIPETEEERKTRSKLNRAKFESW